MKQKLALLLAILTVLSACAFEAESVMKAPKPPIFFDQLEAPIKKIVDDNKLEYTAPVSGLYRQSVQMVDLDGDKNEEALVFLRSKSDRMLSVYLFSPSDSDYVLTGQITNEADTIDSIAYADLNGDGTLELIIGWSKESLKALTVHSVEDGAAFPLLSTDYTDYVLYDLNRDQIDDLVVININTALLTGRADLYSYSEGLLEPASSVALSQGVDEYKRTRQGVLVDGNKALFITCRYQEKNHITDIITFHNNVLSNITLIDNNASIETISSQDLYPSDINTDGVTDLPIPAALPPYDPSVENTDPTFKYVWKNYDSFGRAFEAFETYHSIQSGWYIILPSEWSGRLTVNRSDVSTSRRTVVFAYWREGLPPVDLLTIQLKQKTAGTTLDTEGKILLIDRTDQAVLADIHEDAPAVNGFAITRQELQSRVFPISTDWFTGG